MDDDIERAEARLKAEREALAARARARREQAAADERRSHQIGAELHRLSLLRLVGVPDGVVPVHPHEPHGTPRAAHGQQRPRHVFVWVPVFRPARPAERQAHAVRHADQTQE